jgi:hypothetical protein
MRPAVLILLGAFDVSVLLYDIVQFRGLAVAMGWL